MTHHVYSRYLAIVLAVFVTTAMSAQVVRRGGPPPEVREVLDAFLEAVNRGNADAWEAFAQARFAPSLLQQQTREARAGLYRQMVDRFGDITIEGIRRQGPDAALQLNVKGAKGDGVIAVELDAGTPPRIAGISVEPAAAASDAAPAAGPSINAKMTAAELDSRLDAYFTKLAADDAFSGVALVARNGVPPLDVAWGGPELVERPVFFKAYGLADREKNIPNNIRTRFNLGSINKAFTQVAIRQLAAAGKLSMTDTLGKFFPDYPQAVSRSATVEQLLTMRGGLADFFGEAFTRAPKSQFASNADYFKFVASQPPVFAPGERNQYCNGCYIALGEIVAKASGMPYEKYVAENVFARAEMTSTGYPRSDRPSPDIAQGYTRRGGDGGWRNNLAMHGVTGSAAGGGYSTALDLLTYVKAVRAGKFPGANPDMGIGGGAPGINAIIETRGEWVVIVLANLDPPAASQPGMAIADALEKP